MRLELQFFPFDGEVRYFGNDFAYADWNGEDAPKLSPSPRKRVGEVVKTFNVAMVATDWPLVAAAEYLDGVPDELQVEVRRVREHDELILNSKMKDELLCRGLLGMIEAALKDTRQST